jgi:hypothetical protein
MDLCCATPKTDLRNLKWTFAPLYVRFCEAGSLARFLRTFLRALARSGRCSFARFIRTFLRALARSGRAQIKCKLNRFAPLTRPLTCVGRVAAQQRKSGGRLLFGAADLCTIASLKSTAFSDVRSKPFKVTTSCPLCFATCV